MSVKMLPVTEDIFEPPDTTVALEGKGQISLASLRKVKVSFLDIRILRDFFFHFGLFLLLGFGLVTASRRVIIFSLISLPFVSLIGLFGPLFHFGPIKDCLIFRVVQNGID